MTVYTHLISVDQLKALQAEQRRAADEVRTLAGANKQATACTTWPLRSIAMPPADAGTTCRCR